MTTNDDVLLVMKYIEYQELSRLAKALTHEGPECSVHTRIEAYSCKNIKRDKKLFKSLEDAYNDEVSHSPPWSESEGGEMTAFGRMDEHSSRKTLYLLIATLNVAFPDHEFSDVKPWHFSREPSGASVLNSLSTTLISRHRGPRTYSSYPPTTSDFFPSSVPTSSSPLNSSMASPYAPPPMISGTHPTLYRLLDEVVGLSECEVFSYTPDMESDPHANDICEDEDDSGESCNTEEEEGIFEFDDYDVDESGVRRGVGREVGALLWSSHWFFVNRKQKRILFISVWSRSKVVVDEGERFFGWEGGIGAGARAMGIV